MKGLVSRRPSPALVVAIVALVVAMFGTAYAATQLPKNSVGSKQLKAKSVTTAKIKKEAVTAAKVKKHTLTGTNINLEKLGTVPSANVANVANVANGLAPMEATHFVGAPGEPGFENGSGNAPGELGVNFPKVGFYKDHDGIVHLTGIVSTGTSATTIFTLPAGYRPAAGTLMVFNVFCAHLPGEESCETDSGSDEETYNRLFVVGSNTTAEGTSIGGRVLGPVGALVSLDGVSFRAES